ncbi:MAG: 30S ribosomal protein S3, partial [Candidatus Margulisiibacteriota bacterium]
KQVQLNVQEEKNPDACSVLVAESIAAQLEKRVAHRRAMKQAVSRALRAGAKGIKIICGGRLGGSEIARTEMYRAGRVPLQTLRANIDYGFAESMTLYGKIGVKVWIFKGEVLKGRNEAVPPVKNNEPGAKV